MVLPACVSGDSSKGEFVRPIVRTRRPKRLTLSLTDQRCFFSLSLSLSLCLFLSLEEDKTPGGLGFTKVKLLPDGAAKFTRGMGMSTVWDSERGFGERSWRYSAVVDDMRIEKLFVEGGGIVQNSEPDPFEVSDADTMLAYLREVAAASSSKTEL